MGYTVTVNDIHFMTDKLTGGCTINPIFNIPAVLIGFPPQPFP